MATFFHTAWFLICVLAAFAQNTGTSPSLTSLTVEIRNAKGQSLGTGPLFGVQPRGIKLVLNLKNMPPGKHDFHIHRNARCDAEEDFNTAGLQYDPTGEFYGDHEHHPGGGPAAGSPDKGVEVLADGTARATVVFPNLTLGDDGHSVFANGGTAIIFHKIPGAQGPARIACGVISRPR